MEQGTAVDAATLDGMLRIARFHREHERYYATHELDAAVALRRDAGALRALADRWLSDEAEAPAQAYDDARLRAAGCEDLNAPAALATTGILFMEGEAEPAEIAQMRERLRATADDFEAASRWLAEKMEAGWEREAVLLRPELAELAYRRHMVLARTTIHGQKRSVAARLIRAAHTGLSAQVHDPKTVRAGAEASARLLRTVAWLLDAAAALLAEESGDLAASDPDWTACIEELEERLAAAGGSTAEGGGRAEGGGTAGEGSAPAPASG